MKQILITSLILFLVAFLLPLLAVGQTHTQGDPPSGPAENGPDGENSDSAAEAPPPTPTPTPMPAIRPDAETEITVMVDGEPTVMALSDFLYGVVAAEMPALYPLDALRAQAVAARTYALHALHFSQRHDQAAICDHYAHCLAFRPLEAAIEAWGPERGGEHADTIREAVDSTDGQVLLYDGMLIDALFFAVSSGQTEAADDVWSASVPYLQSVDSSWDSEHPDFASIVRVSHEDARGKIMEAFPEADLSDCPSTWFGEPDRSPAGGITAVSVGGVTATGPELRRLFGLRSHNFTIRSSARRNRFRFNVNGHGHGVGLSQFGARQMALAGHDHREILKHYYTGVNIAGIETALGN